MSFVEQDVSEQFIEDLPRMSSIVHLDTADQLVFQVYRIHLFLADAAVFKKLDRLVDPGLLKELLFVGGNDLSALHKDTAHQIIEDRTDLCDKFRIQHRNTGGILHQTDQAFGGYGVFFIQLRDHDCIGIIHEKRTCDRRAELLSLDHDRIDNVIHTGVTAEHIGFSEVLCHLSCADMLLGTVPSRFIMTGKLCTVGVFFPVLQELSAVFIDQRNIEPGDCMKSLQHIPQFLL